MNAKRAGLFAVETYGEDGKKVCYSEMTVFIVNGGGFGGKRNSTKGVEPLNPPKRNPDVTVDSKTSLDQVRSCVKFE